MNLFPFLRWPLAVVLSFISPGLRADEPDPGQVEISVGRLLEQGHYSRKKLDDNVSKLFLKNYLEALDYNHLYFTQKDVDEFTAKYATSLDDDILLGNPEPAFAIFDLYKKRVEDRVAKVKELLKQKYEFASDKTIEINRQKGGLAEGRGGRGPDLARSHRGRAAAGEAEQDGQGSGRTADQTVRSTPAQSPRADRRRM